MNNIIALNSSVARPFVVRWRFNTKAFWILGFLLIAPLLIFYIFQVNAVTKTSFLILSYEKKVTLLSQENKNLEINFSQVNSLANLETLLKNSNYEKIDKVHYIRVLEGTVVAK